jgi:hypothetical protein
MCSNALSKSDFGVCNSRTSSGCRRNRHDRSPHQSGAFVLIQMKRGRVLKASDKNAFAPYRSTQQDKPARSNNNIGR